MIQTVIKCDGAGCEEAITLGGCATWDHIRERLLEDEWEVGVGILSPMTCPVCQEVREQLEKFGGLTNAASV